MAIATGVAKQLRYKAESAWGTAAGASGAQLLRRVQSTLDLRKQTYQANEIRTDYQLSDFRHGVRSIEGSISGELSPGTYSAFMAAALRKDWAAVTAMASLTLTIATSGSQYTVTRSTGDFIADGLKAGNVIRLSGANLAADNTGKNLLVTALTTTVATVSVLNGTSMTAESSKASSTITVVGKKTFIPTTGHLDTSFSIEHWFSDISQSELFTGCKVQSMAVNLPPTGMATIETAFMGKDVTTAQSAYFSTPTALTTSGLLASVNGVVAVQGAPVALLTGLQFSVAGNMTSEPVVGSNTYPAIFPGRAIVTGQFTAFLQDATLRDYFVNETEVSLMGAFVTGTSGTADFVAFSLPRIKLGGATKSDGEKGIVLTAPFQALFNGAGGANSASEATTLAIQDSTVA